MAKEKARKPEKRDSENMKKPQTNAVKAYHFSAPAESGKTSAPQNRAEEVSSAVPNRLHAGKAHFFPIDDAAEPINIPQNPRSAEFHSAEFHSAESRSAEPHAAESVSVEVHSAELHAAEPRSVKSDPETLRSADCPPNPVREDLDRSSARENKGKASSSAASVSEILPKEAKVQNKKADSDLSRLLSPKGSGKPKKQSAEKSASSLSDALSAEKKSGKKNADTAKSPRADDMSRLFGGKKAADAQDGKTAQNSFSQVLGEKKAAKKTAAETDFSVPLTENKKAVSEPKPDLSTGDVPKDVPKKAQKDRLKAAEPNIVTKDVPGVTPNVAASVTPNVAPSVATGVAPNVAPKTVGKECPESSRKRENDALLSALRASDIKGDAPTRKRSVYPIVRRILMVVLLAVMLAAAVNLIVSIYSRKKADLFYKELRRTFYAETVGENTVSIGTLAKDGGSSADTPLYSDSGDIYEAPDITAEDLHTLYLRMQPGLEALKKVNSSVFGWIKVEGTRVDYPVVRSPRDNNDYYLTHALDLTYSDSGSIFMDFANNTDLSKNRNTCIYGHNMNDGTMFQTIMNFRSIEQFRNGRIYVYTQSGIYVYTPIAVYDAEATESFFHVNFEDDAAFSDFLTEIREKSLFRSSTVPKTTDKIVTLITCTNTIVNKRFVVHGVLTDIVQ